MLKGDDTIVAAPTGWSPSTTSSAPALATAGTGDVLSGIIGAHLAKGIDPFAAACAGVRRHAAAGRVAAAEHGADGVIARDVIAALPRALDGEPARARRVAFARDGGPAGRGGSRGRPRQPRGDRAQRRAHAARAVAGARRRALCAVVKADGYGHGAVPERARRARRRRDLARRRRGRRGRRAARRRDRRADPRHGRAVAVRARRRARADADVVAWDEAFVAAVAARGGGAVHVKLDTGMGRLGTRDPAAATRVAEAAPRRPTASCLAGAMTHFATADERGDAFFAEQLERFAAWAPPLQGGASRRSSCTRPTARARCATRAAHFDMVRAGVAIYGLDPFGEDAARARARAGARAALLRRGGQADRARARARATAGASSRRRRRTPRRCRSGTATACGAR